MRDTEENLDELMDRHLGLFKTSSHPLPDATSDALLHRLRTQAAAATEEAQARPVRGRRWLPLFAAASGLAIVFLVLAIEFRPAREQAGQSTREERSLASRQGAGSRSAFEVVSIRPEVGRGRGEGPASIMVRCGRPYLRIQVTPDRFMAAASVYDLIALAYSKDCLSVTGGPDWTSSEVFAIQAVIPAGGPTYTAAQLRSGDAPELQSMIQTLLAERFHVEIRREMREVPVYNLVVIKPGKFKLADPNEAGRRGPRIPTMGSADTTVRRFADGLAAQLERPVIDKTGLRNSYRMVLEFPELADPPIGPDGTRLRMRDFIPQKLEDQLGLRLQPARAALEMLVIDRVDKPSEN